jgi:hypothetical protein
MYTQLVSLLVIQTESSQQRFNFSRPHELIDSVSDICHALLTCTASSVTDHVVNEGHILAIVDSVTDKPLCFPSVWRSRDMATVERATTK